VWTHLGSLPQRLAVAGAAGVATAAGTAQYARIFLVSHRNLSRQEHIAHRVFLWSTFGQRRARLPAPPGVPSLVTVRVT
jgi:hypothetical protein